MRQAIVALPGSIITQPARRRRDRIAESLTARRRRLGSSCGARLPGGCKGGTNRAPRDPASLRKRGERLRGIAVGPAPVAGRSVHPAALSAAVRLIHERSGEDRRVIAERTVQVHGTTGHAASFPPRSAVPGAPRSADAPLTDILSLQPSIRGDPRALQRKDGL